MASLVLILIFAAILFALWTPFLWAPAVLNWVKFSLRRAKAARQMEKRALATSEKLLEKGGA